MFISPRGTSGSGKTTLARIVLDGSGVFGPREPWHAANRKNPLYYTRRRLDGGRPIAILGSYESPTGGCDTISGNDIPFDIARELHGEFDVFAEGLLLSAEQHRTDKLCADGIPVHLFYFDLPLETCLDGVRSRRIAKGNTSPLNPETTASRWRALRHHPTRRAASGCIVQTGDRKAGVQWLLDLGLAHPDDEEVRLLLSL